MEPRFVRRRRDGVFFVVERDDAVAVAMSGAVHPREAAASLLESIEVSPDSVTTMNGEEWSTVEPPYFLDVRAARPPPAPWPPFEPDPSGILHPGDPTRQVDPYLEGDLSNGTPDRFRRQAIVWGATPRVILYLPADGPTAFAIAKAWVDANRPGAEWGIYPSQDDFEQHMPFARPRTDTPTDEEAR